VDPLGAVPDGRNALPNNWREALMSLVASRAALIQLEARQSAKSGVKRAASMVAAVLCVFFTWALLLAGGIAAISSASGWAWHWIALGTAAIHLLIALLLAGGVGKSRVPSFPVTRAEFQKDRQWIENFQNKPKSNN
jgi:threonine/homoserine/homoserine lactone efflux protein